MSLLLFYLSMLFHCHLRTVLSASIPATLDLSLLPSCSFVNTTLHSRLLDQTPSAREFITTGLASITNLYAAYSPHLYTVILYPPGATAVPDTVSKLTIKAATTSPYGNVISLRSDRRNWGHWSPAGPTIQRSAVPIESAEIIDWYGGAGVRLDVSEAIGLYRAAGLAERTWTSIHLTRSAVRGVLWTFFDRTARRIIAWVYDVDGRVQENQDPDDDESGVEQSLAQEEEGQGKRGNEGEMVACKEELVSL